MEGTWEFCAFSLKSFDLSSSLAGPVWELEHELSGPIYVLSQSTMH